MSLNLNINLWYARIYELFSGSEKICRIWVTMSYSHLYIQVNNKINQFVARAASQTSSADEKTVCLDII